MVLCGAAGLPAAQRETHCNVLEWLRHALPRVLPVRRLVQGQGLFFFFGGGFTVLQYALSLQ